MMMLWLLLWGTLCWAAEAPDPGGPARSTPRLELAFDLIDRGATEVACAQLQAIIDDPISDEERDRARRTARILNHRDRSVCAFVVVVGTGSQATPTQPPGTVRAIDHSGLAELIVSELALGSIGGATLALAAGPSGDVLLGSMILGAAVVGGGAGIAGSTYGVNPSQAMMVSGAGLAGAALGTSLGAIVGWGLPDPTVAMGGLGLVGFLGGTAGGIALATTFPDAPRGDVALVRSAALWGLGLGTGVGWLVAQRDGRAHVGIAIVGTVAGIGAGAGLAHVVDLPRGSVILMDLSVYLGMAFGGMLNADARGPWRGRPGYAWTIGGASGLAIMGSIVALAGPQPRAHASRGAGGPSLSPILVRDEAGRSHPGLSLSGAW